MAFISVDFPVDLTNGITVVTASTPSELVQYQYDGWWLVGQPEPDLPLQDRFAFGPTPPPVEKRRRGMIYIVTPV